MRNKFLLGIMGLMLILEVLVISQEALAVQWCRADCGDGVYVVCMGFFCGAENGSGCTSYDSKGNVVDKHDCVPRPNYA